MKLVTVSLGILLLAATLSPVTAQIRENDASVTALAVQCSISSGYSADDYEEYCRRLAKTLGMLSGEQQTRVFGYLPQPVAAGSESVSPGTIGSVSIGGGNSTSSGSDSGSSGHAETNALVSLVGEINGVLDGNVQANATVVAGSSGDSFMSGSATLPLDNQNGEGGGSTGSRSSGSLSEFLAWLGSLFSMG